MQGHYTPFIQKIVAMATLPDWLNYTLVGEFGVLTMSINYIFGLLLPLVISFYILLSIFEDSGYLPRLAFLIDKVLANILIYPMPILDWIGGKQVINHDKEVPFRLLKRVDSLEDGIE